MERYFTLFIAAIYISSTVLALSILQLSAHFITHASKTNRKRYVGASFILLALLPILALSLFLTQVTITLYLSIVLATAAIATGIVFHFRFDTKMSWLLPALALSSIAIIGIPLVFFWYGNIVPAAGVQNAEQLRSITSQKSDFISNSAQKIDLVANKVGITTLPKEVLETLADTNPSFVVVANKTTILFSNKESGITGPVTLWFPWIDSMTEKSNTGYFQTPTGKIYNGIAYLLPESFLGASYVIVGYEATPEHLIPKNANISSIGLSSDRGLAWKQARTASEGTIISSVDFNILSTEKDVMPSHQIIDTTIGRSLVSSIALPSLDENHYNLVALSML